MKFLRALILCVIALLTLSALWLFLHQENAQLERYGDRPVVQAMPPSPSTAARPYASTHPSRWTRPDDPFEYPIPIGAVGPHEPLYSSPLGYPFACDGDASGYGQPRIDNRQGWGIPVYAADNPESREPAGYSKDCLYPTRVDYLYNRQGTDRFYPLSEANGDIAQLSIGGATLDFIVRVETGTINRFFYSITALRGPEDQPEQPDMRYWNGDLIYQFKGGVGIGHRQGRLKPHDVANRRLEQLRQGYAIASSSGNQTSYHYDLLRAEETALRVKRQFSARYGEPRFTLGIGGSGGAIQQYLIGQNGSGVLDAGVALYAYPDMLTQTIHIFDCELLEYYFDQLAPEVWPWPKRSLIEGLNALNGIEPEYGWTYELAQLIHGRVPPRPKGSSECVNGWRGLTSLVNNPSFVHFAPRFSETLQQQVHWTYWEDLRHIFGSRADGYARQTWDNVGVQYGLRALRSGEISPTTFLHLNASIGGWKAPGEMQPEHFWRVNGSRLIDFSPWGQQNMNLSPDGGLTPAKRTEADPGAIDAAFRSGQVFTGQLDIPIVDLRHYLEPELDMHHLSASFSTRLRLQSAGRADNQLIWVTEKPHSPIAEALALLTQWLEQGQRPRQASDRCYNRDGSLIASGPDVWNGQWNGRENGLCSQRYPSFGTSRSQAGEGLRGDLFKCQRIPVDRALATGVYSPIDMQPYRQRLQQIFADGVCDYSRPGVERPD
ncbi:DUF6351 family protein [Marinobacterium sp. YM272]|uniref:DUF6351 family protein n=1 Tax=Marinobacterium sp. YM272 TaxID=3421654 RepID=UPI003D7F833F